MSFNDWFRYILAEIGSVAFTFDWTGYYRCGFSAYDAIRIYREQGW